jgi:hypothetical protein
MGNGAMSGDAQRISRREALRRTALVGGAVWAAPTLATFAAPAGAGTPPPCPAGLYGFKINNSGGPGTSAPVAIPNTGNMRCLGPSYADTFRNGVTGGNGGANVATWTVNIERALVEGCLRCGGGGVTQLRFTNTGSGDYGPGTGTFVVSPDRKTITVTCTKDNGQPQTVGHLEIVYRCT